METMTVSNLGEILYYDPKGTDRVALVGDEISLREILFCAHQSRNVLFQVYLEKRMTKIRGVLDRLLHIPNCIVFLCPSALSYRIGRKWHRFVGLLYRGSGPQKVWRREVVDAVRYWVLEGLSLGEASKNLFTVLGVKIKAQTLLKNLWRFKPLPRFI